MIALANVYILAVEEPGDYIFVPSGVVIVTERHQFTVYCASSNHNRFRAALNRHDWESLERGITFRETNYRLESVTKEMAQLGWTDVNSIPLILRHLYGNNPKHLFFLQRHVYA